MPDPGWPSSWNSWGIPSWPVSDSKGTIVAFHGLHTKEVLEHKRTTGSVIGFPGAETTGRKEILGLGCSVLALAALDESVTEENAVDVKATTLLEVANYPVTPDGEMVLTDRGATVLPDILASGGGVAVSYLEWLQDIQGEPWAEKRVNARLSEVMGAATDHVLFRSENESLSPREAAYLIAVERVAQAEVARGYR